jgi:hypothetical protein|nr:MAG TPA: hypothetical protein [Caudoviricetes sp.]
MIRTVNDVLPGIKRPFRLQDIEFVWEGLNSALASSVGSTPRILSGFNIKADNNLSAGVIAFNGQLYMHPDTDGYRIPLDSEVYAGSAPSADDMRAFADGTVQNMYWYDVLSTNKTIAEGVEGVLVGAFTKANIEAWSAFGGGGGNTKTFNMAGIYGYLATVNPTTITLNAETLNELSDALSLGKQIILTDMAPYADEMYFMELSLYRRDGQTYYFSLRGYTATGSSTALTANGMGFKRSRGITINMTTGVVNTVTNNMVQLNVHSADGATQNIVSSYPNAVFNFLQNVLIKNVGSVATGNWANSKRYDAGINANTDVEFNFSNPLYIGSVKAATIEGVESIAVYNRNESTRRVIHTSNEMLVVPSASTIVKTGIGYLTQDSSNYLGYIGANCKGDDANTFFMFMGWGNNPHIPSYNLSVGSNMFKYKNIDVTLADSTKKLIIRNPSDDRYAEVSSLGILFKPSTTVSHGQGLYVTNADRTKTLGQIGFRTNHNNLTDTQIYITWGGASDATPAKSLIVDENNFTYKNIPIALTEDSKSIVIHRTPNSNNRTILFGGGMSIIPISTTNATGITWRKQDNSDTTYSIGAVTIGDNIEAGHLFMGWKDGSNDAFDSNYNFSVGKNRFTYKNKNIWYDGLTGIINTDALASGAVTNVKLADNSVETSKIQNSAVTNLKLANKNVTIEKLATQVKPHIALSFRQSSIGGVAQSGITIALNPYNIVVSNPTWNASWSAYVWSLNKAFPFGFVPIVNISPSGRTGILGYLYYINYDSAGIVIQLRKADGSLLTTEPKGELNINVTIIIDDMTIDRWMP